jgi:hypothetical protein
VLATYQMKGKSPIYVHISSPSNPERGKKTGKRIYLFEMDSYFGQKKFNVNN